MTRGGRREEQAGIRQLRREIMSIEKRSGGILLPRPKVAELLESQRMLVAIVKQLGRVRLTDGEMKQLNEGDSLKARRETGHITLTYAPVAKSEDEAGEPADDEDEAEGGEDGRGEQG